MAALNLTTPTLAGANEAYTAAAAGGDSFPMPGTIIVKIKNTSGAARNVTLVAQKNCNQGFSHNNVVGPIPTAETWNVRVPDTSRFADANGRIQLTYDSSVGVSVLAYPAA